MKLPVLKTDEGYRRDYLWLPKSKVTDSVKSSLTFTLNSGTVVRAFEETETHIIVPRDYIPFDEWETLPFQINDQPVGSFPKTHVRCNAKPRGTIQKIAHQALLENVNGVLSLACGRGKTVVSIMAWCDMRVPLLVVVHTEELLTQWKERLLQFTDLSDGDIGLYRGDVARWEKPVCIAMLKTLALRTKSFDLPEGFQEHFGLVIYDEVHNLGAPTFLECAAVGRGARWGLSATHERDDGLDALYKYHIGPVVYENLEQDIVPDVVFFRVDTSPSRAEWESFSDSTGSTNVPKLLTWLSEDVERNAEIIHLIAGLVEEDRKILALTSRVGQIDFLAEEFGDTASKIHGSLGKERDGALYRKDLVFASTSIAKEGLDRSDLDTLLLLLPIAREGMFRQILGRGQRRHEGKQGLLVIIIEDRRIPLCVGMCRKLRNHLTGFGYKFRMV